MHALAAGLAVGLFAMPWVLPGWLGGLGLHHVHDLARAWQVACAAACALAMAPALRQARVPGLFWIFALAGLASIAAAAQPMWAAREAAQYAGLVAIAVVAARGLGTEAWGAAAAGGTALYAAVVLLLAGANAATGTAMDPEDLFIGYANHRFYNHVQTVAIVWSAIVALTSTHRALRLVAAGGVVMSLALLALGGGRATALALLAGAIGTRWLLGPAANGLLRPAAKAAVAGLLLWGLLVIAVPAWMGVAAPPNADHELSRLTSDQSRLALWAQALQVWVAHPWLGVGPMHLAHAFNGTAAHPHQLLLQWLAEWGLIATGAVVGLALLAGRALLAEARRSAVAPAASARRTPDPRSLTGAGLVWLWIAVAVDAGLSGNLVMPMSQIWIACAAGWTWRWVEQGRQRRHEIAPPASAAVARTALLVILVALPVGLAVDVARTWPTLEQQLAQAATDFRSWRLHPRFWSHGWF